jgi:hypothetical protein
MSDESVVLSSKELSLAEVIDFMEQRCIGVNQSADAARWELIKRVRSSSETGARTSPADLMRQAFLSYLTDTGASPESHPWQFEKIEAYEACAPETSEAAALRRVIQRHVRWRETALTFLRQVVDGRGTEDEWPALAEFIERSESRIEASTSEKASVRLQDLPAATESGPDDPPTRY